MKEINLTQLGAKKTAVIKEILGGYVVTRRLESMGVRPGKSITMISAHFWRGPVTVIVGKSKVAIGHGMAQRVIVEVPDESGK
ncbi:MAG: FeoA family protein [Candidatus Omnitrophota bacterium]